jgi:hypothetical protein
MFDKVVKEHGIKQEDVYNINKSRHSIRTIESTRIILDFIFVRNIKYIQAVRSRFQ